MTNATRTFNTGERGRQYSPKDIHINSAFVFLTVCTALIPTLAFINIIIFHTILMRLFLVVDDWSFGIGTSFR